MLCLRHFILPYLDILVIEWMYHQVSYIYSMGEIEDANLKNGTTLSGYKGKGSTTPVNNEMFVIK